MWKYHSSSIENGLRPRETGCGEGGEWAVQVGLTLQNVSKYPPVQRSMAAPGPLGTSIVGGADADPRRPGRRNRMRSGFNGGCPSPPSANSRTASTELKRPDPWAIRCWLPGRGGQDPVQGVREEQGSGPEFMFALPWLGTPAIREVLSARVWNADSRPSRRDQEGFMAEDSHEPTLWGTRFFALAMGFGGGVPHRQRTLRISRDGLHKSDSNSRCP